MLRLNSEGAGGEKQRDRQRKRDRDRQTDRLRSTCIKKKSQLIPRNKRKGHFPVQLWLLQSQRWPQRQQGPSNPRPPGLVLPDCSESRALVLIAAWAEMLA